MRRTLACVLLSLALAAVLGTVLAIWGLRLKPYRAPEGAASGVRE